MKSKHKDDLLHSHHIVSKAVTFGGALAAILAIKSRILTLKARKELRKRR